MLLVNYLCSSAYLFFIFRILKKVQKSTEDDIAETGVPTTWNGQLLMSRQIGFILLNKRITIAGVELTSSLVSSQFLPCQSPFCAP